jgi:hypothetical protein
MPRIRPRAIAAMLAILAVALPCAMLAGRGLAGALPLPHPWDVQALTAGLSLLAVGAVFNHRPRWRPAKAFLVDERNQLLREFTLDAACAVTYDQTVGAGALDGADRPVRIAKYHAQTVRGGALGLVLLTEGPAAPDQIEFAREILVNIQGKFEHAVRARLEVAQRSEADLARARRDLEAGEAALQARSRGIAGIVDFVTTTESKITAEVEALREKVRDLERREDQLREDRQASDGLSQHLEELRASLLTRTAEVEALEARSDARHQALDSREEGLRLRSTEVSEREARATERETVARDQGEETAHRSADLSAREESLRAETERTSRSRAENEALQSELNRLRETLDAREARVREEEALKAKEYEDWRVTLDSERALLRQQKESFRKETEDLRTDLAARTTREDERETDLAAREAEVSANKESVARREEELRQRVAALEEAHTAVGDRESAVQAAHDDWTRKSVDLDARQRRLKQGEARLVEEMGRKEKLLKALDAELDERRETLTQEGDARDDTARVVQAEIAQKDEELRGREARLVSMQASLRKHEEILVRERANLEEMARSAEIKRLKAEQARLKSETENDRLHAEIAEARKAAVEKATEFRTDRDRLVRDIEVREKAVLDREAWLRTVEKDLEAKTKELEARKREPDPRE